MASSGISASATTRARRIERSYCTAPEAIYDHFRAARDLHALEPHALDGLEEIGAARKTRKPRGKNDHVVGADLADETDHAGLAVVPVRQDLRGHQPHQVDDLAA